MEFYRPASFESPHEPEQAGTPEAAKKKKKTTTRLPKSTGILPKLETQESKQESTLLPAENTLETLFAREVSREEKPEGGVDTDAGTSGTGLNPEEPAAELPPEPLTLEGEFADEALIITRGEASQTGFRPETPHTVSDTEEAPVGLAESLGEQIEAGDEVSTEAAPQESASPPENPAPEIIPSPRHYEAAPNEPTAPERHQMIDPSVRYGETIQAERYRAETVEPITREDVNRAALRAEKRGTSRGVITGTIFGYWLRGRRNRAELAETRQTVEKQGREIKNLKSEQAVANERLRTLRRSKEELQKHTAERAPEKTSQPFVPEQPSRVMTYEAPASAVTSAEAVREKVRSSENKPKTPELPPEAKPITEETYQAPAGRRVETSSWHRFEIDEKTGKLAENPELAYGQEFKNEQQQELLQRDAAQPHMAMQLGQAVVQGAASSSPASTPSQPPAQPRQATANEPALSAAYVKRQLVRRTTDPVTWVIALAVVVVLFAFGILR